VEKVKAQELLDAERTRVEQLIQSVRTEGQDDRTAANQSGDMFDSAQPLTEEGTDEAVLAGLHDRLAAVDRAEERLRSGTFGFSVRSGEPISDDRLEADPAAELTIEEARQSG
jgi:DnaK suppressor protein